MAICTAFVALQAPTFDGPARAGGHRNLSMQGFAKGTCAMSRKFCSLLTSKLVTFAVTIFAVAASLAGCSEKSQSLADYIAAICAAPFHSASAAEAPYLADNVSAMTKMMIDMGIRPSGDVDTDFVAIMVPHHQGAIEMAQAELRHGHHEPLRRMAQEIIVTQLQEINAMRLSLDQPLPPSISSTDQIPPATPQQ